MTRRVPEGAFGAADVVPRLPRLSPLERAEVELREARASLSVVLSSAAGWVALERYARALEARNAVRDGAR